MCRGGAAGHDGVSVVPHPEVIVSWQVLIVLAEFAVVCAVIGAGTLVQRVKQRVKVRR